MNDTEHLMIEDLKRITHEAGDLLRDAYQKAVHKIQKSTFDFKTQVDDELDAFIRQQIIQRYPEHGLSTEENTDLKPDANYQWIVDPLDGTLNFTIGNRDFFAVSIGLYKAGEPFAGAVYAPLRGEKGEFYFAVIGQGAYCNDQRIHAVECEKTSDMIVALEYCKYNRQDMLEVQHKMLDAVKGVAYTYVHCNASVSLCLVASGKLHAYCAFDLDPWDMAGGAVIAIESGCCLGDRNGGFWSIKQSAIIASAPGVFSRIKSFLSN